MRLRRLVVLLSSFDERPDCIRQKRNANLAETLLCFLDNGHNARIAASVLRIHENTLRQRIETIGRLLGDWKIENKSFEIHAALRLHRLRTDLARMQSEVTTDKRLRNDPKTKAANRSRKP
jgi:hypothetical protein